MSDFENNMPQDEGIAVADTSQKVFDKLDEMKIDYSVVNHEAVYTIEAMDALNIDKKNEVVKNIFVRDEKKTRFMLFVAQKDRRVNLKEIRTKLGCKPLSFAAENYLVEYLGLNKGAVSPFGILNDENKKVEVFLDSDLRFYEKIGIHPNINTQTVWISPKDLEKVIKDHGNKFTYINLKDS
ncbi:MAG: prolyl-tRNA synthetase associated domain-containing protein [Clostridiaceae bacterium]